MAIIDISTYSKPIKDNLADILRIIAPGKDYLILSYKNQVDWREASSFPTIAELNTALATVNQNKLNLDSLRANIEIKRQFVKSLEGASLTNEQIKQVLGALIYLI